MTVCSARQNSPEVSSQPFRLRWAGSPASRPMVCHISASDSRRQNVFARLHSRVWCASCSMSMPYVAPVVVGAQAQLVLWAHSISLRHVAILRWVSCIALVSVSSCRRETDLSLDTRLVPPSVLPVPGRVVFVGAGRRRQCRMRSVGIRFLFSVSPELCYRFAWSRSLSGAHFAIFPHCCHVSSIHTPIL